MLSALKKTNPLLEYNVKRIAYPNATEKDTRVQTLEKFISDEYKVEMNKSTHRSISEAADKLIFCPYHSLLPASLWCQQNDGNNANYRIAESQFCNGKSCDQSEQSKPSPSSFETVAQYRIDQLTQFNSKASNAAHRIRIKYINNDTKANHDIEIAVAKMGKDCFNRYLCDNSVAEYNGTAQIVTGAKSLSNSPNNNDTNTKTQGSCYLALGEDIIIEARLTSFESDFKHRSLQLPIAGGCGMTVSNVSMDGDISSMIGRRSFRRNHILPMQTTLVESYESGYGNKGRTVVDGVPLLDKNVIFPFLLIYTSTERWRESLSESLIIIHKKKAFNGSVFVNDILCPDFTNANATAIYNTVNESIPIAPQMAPLVNFPFMPPLSSFLPPPPPIPPQIGYPSLSLPPPSLPMDIAMPPFLPIPYSAPMCYPPPPMFDTFVNDYGIAAADTMAMDNWLTAAPLQNESSLLLTGQPTLDDTNDIFVMPPPPLQPMDWDIPPLPLAQNAYDTPLNMNDFTHWNDINDNNDNQFIL